MSIGVHIGPFWISSRGHRRKKSVPKCARCHLMNRLPRKSLCEECLNKTPYDITVRGLAAVDLYNAALKEDSTVGIAMMKESLKMVKEARHLESFGFKGDIGGQSSENWIISIHHKIDELKKEPHRMNKEYRNILINKVMEAEIGSALSSFKSSRKLDSKGKYYELVAVLSLLTDLKFIHPIVYSNAVVFGSTSKSWEKIIRQEYKQASKEWGYIR